MQKYFEVLRSAALFEGIENADLAALLQCLGSEVRDYGREEVLLLAGDAPKNVGILLAGLLHIFREDCDGNRSLVAAIAPGELFAESLCCAGVAESPVTVVAAADSTVLLLRFERILRTCADACAFHRRLMENMLRLVANKNLFLQTRMEIIACKSIRAKVLLYFETFAPKWGESFVIPFNREEMAEYLCVERSALSHELARMRRDRLLVYRKNRFELK